MSHFKIFFHGVSDIGLVRRTNQDLWAPLPQQRLFILADGMGGHQAGDVAARETVASLLYSFSALGQQLEQFQDYQNVLGFMQAAILEANRNVYALSRQQTHLRGMGTTLCCLYVHHQYLIYGHVGDSRIYCYRNGVLKCLTQDHSLCDRWLREGKEIEGDMTRYRHILTQAIGVQADVDPDFGVKRLCDEDLYLMCTDGLSDYLSQASMQQIMQTSDDLEMATQRLISAAKKEGSRDNITVVMTKMEQIYEPTYLSR